MATVLFADLVGFTRLAEVRDPEQVKNLVDSCFERLVADINSFGGKVDKIIGDAILALFGAPVAHEDDAERAVRAALRMQETIAAYATESAAEIQMRIGINTGEVLVGSLRAGGEYTAMGDVVNTAQRLQTLAEPGSVVVGPATHAATKDCIQYRPLGSLRAKGREEPVEAWVALEPLLPPGYRKRRLQTPFVGRQAELAVLGHAVRVAADRRRAHFALIIGDAGVGKTRLAEEVAAVAGGELNAAVYEGRCVPYGEANVWWPLAEAMRRATGVGPDDLLDEAMATCTGAVGRALGQPSHAPEVKRVTTGLLFLMGYEVPLRDIDQQRAREEISRSLIAFLDGVASRQPVMIVLSDLHWADDVVLGLTREMLERLSRSPLVVVGTARPELLERWPTPTGRHNSVVINLDPLDRAATEALLAAVAETELPDELRDELLDRSGGNPFFLEELVALVAEGGLSRLAGTDRRGMPLLDLPDTLRGLVAARIDALGRGERAVLEDASVWGRSGPLAALERMAEQVHGLTDIRDELAGLVNKEILVVEGSRWSFRSDLLREVAYGTLTKTDRARRHCGTAYYLEHSVAARDDADDHLVDVVAYHYGAAAQIVKEIGPIDGIPVDVVGRAVDWLEEAANRAQVAQVLPVSARLFGIALDLVGDELSARRARLLLGRAGSLTDLRDLEHARVDIEEAMEIAALLGDDRLSAHALLALGDFEQKGGQLDAALATLHRAVDRFEQLGDTKGRADALRVLGLTQMFQGANEQAEASISGALLAYESLSDRRGQAWALQNLAWISYIRGRASEAEERLGRSAATFTELGDSGGLMWVLGLMAFVKYHQGRFAEAEDVGEQVLVEARQRGDRWGEGMMLLLMAGVRLWSGRTSGAVTAARDALRVFRSIGDRFAEAQALAFVGRAEVAVGNVAEGLHVLEEALDGFREARQLDELREVLAGALAGAATQIGAPDLALTAVANCDVDELSSHGIGNVDLLVARGIALMQAGEVERAVDALLTLIEPEGAPPPPYAMAALALAYAAAGSVEEAERRAATVLEDPRSTYSDRTLARLAGALSAARASGSAHRTELAACRLDEISANLRGVEDQVTRAVVTLAWAAILQATGDPSAASIATRAERQLAALGIDGEGWRRLFNTALYGAA